MQEPLPYWVVAHVVLICAGLVPTVHAFVQFAKADGTHMPLAAYPTPTVRVSTSHSRDQS